MQRSVLQSKQDAQEQKAKSDWLTFRGPHVVIENHQPPVLDKSNESEKSLTLVDMKLACHIAGILSKRIDVDIDEQKGDITYVGIREANENTPRLVLVRFQEQSMRDEIWQKRKVAKKNGIIIEEWLTDHRARLYKKCKELKSAKVIKDVITEEGDIYAILMAPSGNHDSQNNVLVGEEAGQQNKANYKQGTGKYKEKFEGQEYDHNYKICNDQQLEKVKVLVTTDADYENLVKRTRKIRVNANEEIF